MRAPTRVQATATQCSIAFLLAACGGGGGGSGTGAPAGSITGTAATGSPIAGATVTLKDAAGASRSATTASNGSYSIGTSGLTPPFFLQIAHSGNNLYSVSADANATATINLTPLTDLIVRSWYDVQGVSVDAAFAAPASNPAPSPAEVQIISRVVQNVVQLWLNQAGVTDSSFNLISTPFTANGTGIDLVLDRATVNTSTGVITITDGTTTQSSTLTAAAGAMTVATTTTAPSGTSSSATSTVVPVQSAQQQALSGITATLNALANVVNTKGTSLQAADVLPFLDPGLLNDGLDRNQFATDVVNNLAGGVTVSFSVLRIKSLDAVGNVADIVVRLSTTLSDQTRTDKLELFFRKVNDAWLVSGNQRLAAVVVQAEARTNQGAQPGNNGPAINVDLQAPVGTVAAVSVTGGIWNGAALTKESTIVGVGGNPNLDHFVVEQGPLASLPAAGTPFTLTAAKSGGGTVQYTVRSNAFTTEAIRITNLTDSSLAGAKLGQPLTVAWTLPKTFPISRIRLNAGASTGPQGSPGSLNCILDDSSGAPILGITATTAQITIPATCADKPVLEVDVSVSVDGLNGEREHVTFFFK